MLFHKKRKKILVVEDEADMLTFLSTLMDTHGFKPVLARNKSEAWAKAMDEHPACIILNGLMAGEEGMNLYCMLKGDTRLRDVPVIIVASIPRNTFFHYHKFGTGTPDLKIPEPEGYLETPPEADELVHLTQQLVTGDLTDA